MEVGLKIYFELDPNPKNSLERPKKMQKRPQIWPNYKQKDRAVFQIPKLIFYIGRFQKCF